MPTLPRRPALARWLAALALLGAVAATDAEAETPAGKGAKFYKDLGKQAKDMLGFSGDKTVAYKLKHRAMETDFEGSLKRSLSGISLASPKDLISDTGFDIDLKATRKYEDVKLWAEADVFKQKIKLGSDLTTSAGPDATLGLTISTQAVPGPVSYGLGVRYTKPKLNLDAKLNRITAKNLGPVEMSGQVKARDDLSLVGAVTADASDSSSFSPKSLMKMSALGAQYSPKDYTLTALTEGVGQGNKLLMSTKLGESELGLSFEHSPGNEAKAMAVMTRKLPYEINAKAGLSTAGDVLLALKKRLAAHAVLNCMIRSNLKTLNEKPQFGLSVSFE